VATSGEHRAIFTMSLRRFQQSTPDASAVRLQSCHRRHLAQAMQGK